VTKPKKHEASPSLDIAQKRIERLTAEVDKLLEERTEQDRVIGSLQLNNKRWLEERQAGANLVSSVRSVIELTAAAEDTPKLLAVSIVLADALVASRAGVYFSSRQDETNG
jgi:hypothetical protein